MPVASTKEGRHVYDLWMWSWLAAMLTGVVVWGLIFYAGDPLPPPQRDRHPGADALQPADRDLLHDRAGHDGDRLLLLHRRRAEQGRRTTTRTPTRPSRWSASSGRGRSTTTSSYDKPRTTVRAGRRRRRRLRGRHHRRPAHAVAGQGQERAVLPRLARRHPLVLGPRRSCSRWTSSRAATTRFTITPDAIGHLRRVAAPSCAASTTRGCCSTSRSSTRRRTTPT